MKLIAKIDYACKALLELSLRWPHSNPVSLTTIADQQDIPIKFLTQIMLNLKQIGYVDSIRGKSGGYLLIKPPKDIILSDVLQSFEAGIFSSEKVKSGSSKHIMDMIWQEVDEAYLNHLKQINFEIICNRKKQKDNFVMFEI